MTKHLCMKSVVAATALAGALTFGLAGMAGAASTPAPATSSSGTSAITPAATPASPATKAARCAKFEARVPKIQAREAKVATWMAKADARESKATSGNHTKIARGLRTGSTGSRRPRLGEPSCWPRSPPSADQAPAETGG